MCDVSSEKKWMLFFFTKQAQDERYIQHSWDGGDGVGPDSILTLSCRMNQYKMYQEL